MPENVLDRYHRKRRFDRTAEPEGGAVVPSSGRLFVVQKHAARRLHYDLRLQFGDVLKSWAVTRGPSLDPADRRLAVHVEDHPLDYAEFEGEIPQGEYGAGSVIVWDRGSWVPMGDAEEGYGKGVLKFRLAGEKLAGGWSLIRLKQKGQRGDNWLLIKERDVFARAGEGDALLEQAPMSVISGRRIEEAGSIGARPVQRKTLSSRRKPRPRPDALEGAHPGELPPFVAPQLASPRTSAPEGGDWLHEIKFDGYRTFARVADGGVRLLTRNGHDWTDRYGELGTFFEALASRALIDGEIIVQDEHGVSSFAELQDALANGETHRLLFYAFDIVHLDGFDLTAVPLIARKDVLCALIRSHADAHSSLQFSEHVTGGGPEFSAQACRNGLEGIVSKRLDAPYRSGRTRDWYKVKCFNTDEFVIIGFSQSEAAGGLAALLLAEPRDDVLAYVGRVGTGFTAKSAEDLRVRLKALSRDAPPIVMPQDAETRDVTWTEPTLMAEVQYGARTAERRLRQASFRGLRQDKVARQAEPSTAPPPATATQGTAPAAAAMAGWGGRRLITDEDLAAIWVSNPEREMFGAGGPTKLQLVLYYATIGDRMLPELLQRPVSLVRCPTGDAATCFFQRHASSGMPTSIGRISLREEAGEHASREHADYLFLEDARGFLGLCQFGTVEFHPWGCRVDEPERPDRMIFDLDPDESVRWRDVVDAGEQVREALDALGAPSFVKTTGGKGLHVVVPLQRRHTWELVFGFSRAFAEMLAATAPGRFTAVMAKSARRGRVFIDFHRNRRGSTAVAAYSLRAKPGAPVSTPLSWRALRQLDDPRDLDWSSVPKMLVEAAGDPWQAMKGMAAVLTQNMQTRLGLRLEKK